MAINKNLYKFLFAAGGTGGHLFPAVAVAEQIQLIKPESNILFVGTKNKVEAKVIPNLGFGFKTIWISGFSRKFSLNNILFPLKLIFSSIQITKMLLSNLRMIVALLCSSAINNLLMILFYRG